MGWGLSKFFRPCFGVPRKRPRVSKVVVLPARLVAGKRLCVPDGVFVPARLVPKKKAATDQNQQDTKEHRASEGYLNWSFLGVKQ